MTACSDPLPDDPAPLNSPCAGMRLLSTPFLNDS